MPRLAPKISILAALVVLTLPACSSGPYKAPTNTPTASPATPTGTASPAASPTGTATPTATGTQAAAVAGTQIVIGKFLYSPVNLQVKPGAKVTVVNQDPVAHTVTAETASAFDTGTINPNATGSFTAPTTPGTYPYICTFHSQMHGVLTVAP